MSSEKKRKVCVILVDRANYGRMKPVIQALHDHPKIELQIIASGTMVLERFQRTADTVRADGFPVNAEVYMELEGSIPTTMAKSVGFGIVEFSNEYRRLSPDLVLMIGDRYEALAAVIAAAYMNLCIAHIQGGEVSGSIDESARHAITKFAHFHFPSTKRAADYLVRMGERPETILGIGCPGSDIARMLDRKLTANILNVRGSGLEIDVAKPFLLSIYHPTTTSYGSESDQMHALLVGLASMRMQTVLLWPNIDAGSDHISKIIRRFRDQHHSEEWLRIVTNFTPENYLKVLSNTVCAVGNSSSFVRDAGYFGTPVVLVGNRQEGRERDIHVTQIKSVAEDIESTIRKQLQHGRYDPSTLYGDGYVSKAIAEAVAELNPYRQKTLHFVNEQND